MPLKLADFRIHSAVLELRYSKVFALWDNAGAMAAGLQGSFPALDLEDAKPNAQRFLLEKGMSAELKIDRAHISHFYPDSALEKLQKGADVFCEVLTSGLNQREFERIGLRIIFEKLFETRDDAAAYLTASAPTLVRQGKFFNVEGGHLLDGDVSFRWEGETLGCRVQLMTGEKTLEVSIPADFPDVPPIKSKKRMVLVDVDYYAHSNTPVAKFKASAVIESWLRVIRRDLEGFVDG